MNIPVVDNIAKLLVFGGIALLIYATEYIKPQYESIEKMQFQKDSVDRILKAKLDRSQATFEFKMQLFQLQNPDLFDSTGKIKKGKEVISSDYYPRFDRYFNDDTSIAESRKNFMAVDSLKQHSLRFALLINTNQRNYSEQLDKFILAAMVGFILLVFGLGYWISRETFEHQLLRRSNIDKPTFSYRCQSCAKIFDSMVTPGTDSNDQKNYNFCSSCYQHGIFQDENLEELKQRMLTELTSKKSSNSVRERALRLIPRMDRWKKNQY